MMVQDLLAPPAEGLRQPPELGPGVLVDAPRDGVIETGGCFIGIIGAIDVAEFLGSSDFSGV